MKILKHILFTVIFACLFLNLSAQKTLPILSLKTNEGNLVKVQDIGKEGTVVICFWATWCVPCIKELDAISDLYPDWQEETGVELIAVSVDDSRTISRVNSLVNGKAWEYKILLDTNQEFKRAMNISSVPYLIIINNGEIVYNHSGYTPGSEYKLYDEILKLNQ